jgi:hypothetical protein
MVAVDPNTLSKWRYWFLHSLLIGSTPERWRIVNSCVSQYQTISIPGAEIFQVSADSSRLSRLTENKSSNAYTWTENRADLSLPLKAGIYKVQNESTRSCQELNSIQLARSITAQELLPLSKISKIDKAAHNHN